jgi:hypothetical protein
MKTGWDIAQFSYMWENTGKHFLNKTHLFWYEWEFIEILVIITDMYVEGRVVHIF